MGDNVSKYKLIYTFIYHFHIQLSSSLSIDSIAVAASLSGTDG